MARNSHSQLNKQTEDQNAVNPHWVAFFREVRRLATLARQREAAAAALQQVTPAPQIPSTPQATLATTNPLDNEKAPAPAGANSKRNPKPFKQERTHQHEQKDDTSNQPKFAG